MILPITFRLSFQRNWQKYRDFETERVETTVIISTIHPSLDEFYMYSMKFITSNMTSFAGSGNVVKTAEDQRPCDDVPGTIFVSSSSTSSSSSVSSASGIKVKRDAEAIKEEALLSPRELCKRKVDQIRNGPHCYKIDLEANLTPEQEIDAMKQCERASLNDSNNELPPFWS